MGVTVTGGTMPGGVTPVCNACGTALCWDLSEEEYQEAKAFWDDWECKDCNPEYRGALARYNQGRNNDDQLY